MQNYVNCKNCGGLVIDDKQKYHHLKRCKEYKEEGIDHLSCKICGFKSSSLSEHLKIHNITQEEYKIKFSINNLVAKNLLEKRGKGNIGKTLKPLSESSKSKTCEKCNELYDSRKSSNHFLKCYEINKDKWELGKDYVKCEICGIHSLNLSFHLKQIHKWTKEQFDEAKKNGVKMMPSSIKEKTSATILKKYGVKHHWESPEVREKIRLTMQEKYGADNPFASKEIQEKIHKTNRERYGVDHPMQNEDVFISQQKSSGESPNQIESFFDINTSKNVVFTGYGGRIINVKSPVNKYGREVFNLCPDFMIFSDNICDFARELSNKKERLDTSVYRSKYVIEIFGEYYHNEEKIGIPKEQHYNEVIEAYKSVGIECLIVWDTEINTLEKWNVKKEEINLWIDKALKSI